MTLTACSEPNNLDTSWRDYQTNLTEAVQAPAPPVRPTPLPIMPRSADLRINIERLSVGLLDALRLDQCRLGQVIAQRNSALGHAQSATARLRYELDSMLAIEECLQSEAMTEPRITTLLEDALTHKHTTLPLYIDQVLTRSDAFRQSLRAARRPHPLVEDTSFTDTLAALEYLTQTFNAALSNELMQVDLAAYNRHIQTLSQSDFLPRHWRTMQTNAAWLTSLNRYLEDAKIDCAHIEPPGRAVHSMFTTTIAPLLQRWADYHYKLAPPLLQLQAMSVQGEWRAYIGELIGAGSHAEQVSELTARHSDLRQQTFSPCQLEAE